jgi:hypothetical protein
MPSLRDMPPLESAPIKSLRDMPPLESAPIKSLRDMPPLESPPASPPLAPTALPALPNTLILKILGDLRKSVKDEHQQKLSKCFKEMNQRHRGTLHIWYTWDDGGDPPENLEDRGATVKDVWFLDQASEERRVAREAGREYDVFDSRLWETDEDCRWMDENDIVEKDLYYEDQDDSREVQDPLWFNNADGRVWLVDGRGNKTSEHLYMSSRYY